MEQFKQFIKHKIMKKKLIVFIFVLSLLSCNNQNVVDKEKWIDIVGDTAVWNKEYNKDTIIQLNIKLEDSLHLHN